MDSVSEHIRYNEYNVALYAGKVWCSGGGRRRKEPVIKWDDNMSVRMRVVSDTSWGNTAVS